MSHLDEHDAITSYEVSLDKAGSAAAMRRRLHGRHPLEIIKLPAPDWLIPGLLQRKAIHVISADSGSGKTWLALQCMLAGASRTHVLGHLPAERFDTLYLGADSPDWDLGNQLRQLMLATGVTFPEHSESIILPYGLNLMDPSHFETVLDYVHNCGIRLIVLDVMLYATQGVNENDNSEMAAVYNRLKLLRDKTGCAILGLHHWKKGSDIARGAGTIIQASEHAFNMYKTSTADIKIKRMKIRGEADWPELTVRLAPGPDGGLALRLAEPAENILLTWFAFSASLSRNELQERATAAGYSAAWLGARLTEARRDGTLTTDGKGVWRRA